MNVMKAKFLFATYYYWFGGDPASFLRLGSHLRALSRVSGSRDLRAL